MSLARKFNEDFKNLIKTVIFLLQVGFIGDFLPDCPFKLYFQQLKFWHRFSPWFYLILLCFFMSLDRKFNEDFKNVLKTVIFQLQVGFTGDFLPGCPSKLCFKQFKFWHHFSRRLDFVVFFYVSG